MQQNNLLDIQNKTPCGLRRRISAAVLDILIVIFIIFLLLIILRPYIFYFTKPGCIVTESTRYIFYLELYVSYFIIFLGIVFYLYNNIYIQARIGQTVGKKILGLYTLNDTEYMSLKTSSLRFLISSLSFFIDPFVILFRRFYKKDNKRICDIIFNTTVYCIDEKKYKLRFILSLLFIFIILIIFSIIFNIKHLISPWVIF